jgi:hypothetical protein
MAALVPYLAGGESITPAEMNAVFGRLNTAMETIFRGRSFLLANRDRSFTSINGNIRYPGTPYAVLGKCFYFTSGATAYAQYLPGAVVRTVQVLDPVDGVVVDAQGVRPYSHEEFSNAASTATISSTDTNKRIATIPTHGDSFYTDGIVRLNGVSLFEHSLEAHTRQIGESLYYLKESGAPIPEKRYSYALAEIIIEGVAEVNLAVCTLSKFKYKCLRFHNLQSNACSVALPDGNDIELEPFECKSYRLNVAGTAFEESSMRYFQTFRGTDPRMFWFWNTLPSASAASSYAEVVTTATGGMQGNNLSNPALVYDFLNWLHDPTGNLRHARFNRNVHELCDQSSLFAKLTENQAGKFAALNASGLRSDAKVADLFWHTGTLKIKRVSRTLFNPTLPGIRLVTNDEVLFRGVDTIVADFAAKQIAVSTNANGNLELLSTDPDNSVDLIGLQTNLLKTTSYGGDAAYYVIPTAVNIDNPIELEFRIFENNGGAVGTSPNQNPYGSDPFNLLARGNYRITQRHVVNGAAESRTYKNLAGATVTVTGDTPQTLSEVTLGTAPQISGIHDVPVSDLLALGYFGNSALSSQTDDYVTFSAPELTLTPEGWVLTFTESVDATILPSLSGLFYTNFIGNKYTFNEAAGRFEFKHAIRFRKHGFGFGQLGKDNAAFFTPTYGRARVVGYTEEVSGADGADFGFPDQLAVETNVKLLRQISKNELGDANAGGRFMKAGGTQNLDGLVQFDANDSNGLWYPQWRFLMLSGNSDIPRVAGGSTAYLIAMPLEVPHFNGMAQAVNQIESGKVLDWKAIRIPYGPEVLDFDIEQNAESLYPWVTQFGPAGSTLPAPINAFAQIIDLDADSAARYWRHYFSANDVNVFRAADMPEWSSMRTATSTKGEWTMAVHIDVTTGGSRPSGNGALPWVHSGTVNISLGPLTWSAEQVDQGLALLAVPGYGNRITLSQYAAAEWVSIDDFETLVESLGFTFEYSETRVPLILGHREFPEVEMLPFSAPSGSITADVHLDRVQDFSGYHPSTDVVEVGRIVNTNEIVNATLASLTIEQTIHKRQIAFSQPFPGEIATWKIASGGTCWRVTRRTIGESPIVYGAHIGTIITRGQGGANSVTVEINRTLRNSVQTVYQSAAPWFPETAIVGTTQPFFGVVSTIAAYGEIGRVFYKHQTSSGADAETLYRYLGAEEMKFECFVASGSDATQSFYKVPQTQWGAAAVDWWDQSTDHRMASLLGVATTPHAFQSASGSLSVVSCPPGVTEIAPAENQKLRLLKDPLELVVDI